MRRILICTGILGGGTALTFAAAALAATLLPGGTVVPVGGVFEGKWAPDGVAVPVPAPVVVNGGWAPGPAKVIPLPEPSD